MGRTVGERARARFETTQWSRVIKPGRGGAREALAALCQAYWQPTYCFVRARGFGAVEAEDLTQGFFASLLEPRGLAKVDPERGRFRDWLRAAVKNFLCNELDRRRAQKRGGGMAPITLDVEIAEESLRLESQDALAPDRIFERRWALTVTARALARVREDYAKEGKADLFSRLEAMLSGEEVEMTDAELAEVLGKTPTAIKVERHRMKMKIRALYRHYLREEIRETVADSRAIDAEIRILLDALA